MSVPLPPYSPSQTRWGGGSAARGPAAPLRLWQARPLARLARLLPARRLLAPLPRYSAQPFPAMGSPSSHLTATGSLPHHGHRLSLTDPYPRGQGTCTSGRQLYPGATGSASTAFEGRVWTLGIMGNVVLWQVQRAEGGQKSCGGWPGVLIWRARDEIVSAEEDEAVCPCGTPPLHCQ